MTLLLSFIGCRKESENCHYFIKIKNNSNENVIFYQSAIILDKSMCSIVDVKKIVSNDTYEYRYSLWDCLELSLKGTRTKQLQIIDPKNYSKEVVPCEEFEEQNTILRTYSLTLEDLERMNYTINYPEDQSIEI